MCLVVAAVFKTVEGQSVLGGFDSFPLRHFFDPVRSGERPDFRLLFRDSRATNTDMAVSGSLRRFKITIVELQAFLPEIHRHTRAMNLMKRTTFLPLLIASLVTGSLHAEKSEVRQIQFKRGKSEAIVTGKVKGREEVVYKIRAREGQFLQVQMLPGSDSADYNIYIPGRGAGDEALFGSAAGGSNYLGQLYKTGDHTIMVFQNRAAARRGETASYKILVSVTDKIHSEEKAPANMDIPKKVITDCRLKLAKQLGRKKLTLLSARRGENSYIVDFEVAGVAQPWRCYHDGTKCTGTEYQGEG